MASLVFLKYLHSTPGQSIKVYTGNIFVTFFVHYSYVFIINNYKSCIVYLGYSGHPYQERFAKNWSSIANTVDLLGLEAIATVVADLPISSLCCNLNPVTRK